MEKSILTQYGIKDVRDLFYNPSYEFLREKEVENRDNTGAKVTTRGAMAIDTGIFTGRSPSDKYIVSEPSSEKNIWWRNEVRKDSDNKPISQATWKSLYDIASTQLTDKNLFVMDAYCGANPETRLKIRVITEIAWVAHFVKNMFIRPTEDELIDFIPDFTMLHACKAKNPNWQKQGLNSDVFVAFNIAEKLSVIGGTWYGGEVKKGFFSIMNYFIPLRGMASMHCSANIGSNNDSALFFGLSGTGKTTLSTDAERKLIGDDEHGWDDDGVFNYEGGCYAKCINLDKGKEPEIYGAIRENALLENVVLDKDGFVDFEDGSKTENTRVSYPIYHIENIATPSKGPHPKNIIFLCADAFGIFPPVAKLNRKQAMYYYLSGYTAKVAGTERGIMEPVPTFSAGFGAAFLLLHPLKYAKELDRKITQHNTNVWLVNTGWIGGEYGKGGHRIDLPITRKIIRAILDGSLKNAEYETLEIFNLEIPTSLKGVDSSILNPKKQWDSQYLYLEKANQLAILFRNNFHKYLDHELAQSIRNSSPCPLKQQALDL